MKTQKAAALATLLIATMLTGCAATQVAIEKKDLNVSSTMTNPIFVTPGMGKNILIQVRNMSTLKVASETLQLNVENSFRAKGYNVVTDPASADYILQAQLMEASAEILSARQLAGGQQGVGSAAGAVLGGLLASGTNSWRSVGVAAGVGALAGGIAETIADAAVKAATYHLTFAVRVTEVPTKKESETKVTFTAEKVQMKPDEALPILVEKTCEALANVM
ncbi:complement resistance protein TraT [Desulfosoma sp.]